ncbi:MAG: mechanosensitive ion channel [Clostridiales bacterium]|nr:mechanosensitive ion channel [Clostridiales bacterium]
MLLEFETLGTAIRSMAYEYLGKTGGLFIDFVGKCIVAILIVVIGLRLADYLVKICTRIFEQSKMDPMVKSFLLSAERIGLKILIGFMAVTELGVATSSIVAVVGSCGLALGLSLQGSLSNIAGGVILLVVKPFEVGDYIQEESSGKEGTVQSIGIMYTKLVNIDNKTILIPNGNLSNASITNITHQENRQMDLTIGIEYSEDIKKVKDLLLEIVQSEEVLLEDRPIKIFVSAFQESNIDIGLRYWVRTEDYWESRWRVLEKIKYAFDENDITIPFNQLDVNLVKTEQ